MEQTEDERDLAGREKEKKERWNDNSGQIVIDVSDPSTLETI